jgi:HAMP domain-containing protein
MSSPASERRIKGPWILLVAVIIIGALAWVIWRGVTRC